MYLYPANINPINRSLNQTMALRLTRALLTTGMKPSPNLSPPPPQGATSKTVLEVERKFRALAVPSLTNAHLLKFTGMHCLPLAYTHYTPLFKSVVPLATTTIHDVYYDTPGAGPKGLGADVGNGAGEGVGKHRLSALGAWVRRRNGEWEAKVRRGGDFVNSRFEELSEVGEIAECVKRTLEGSVDGSGGEAQAWEEKGEEENFGLEKMAEFVTTREGWVVDGEFKVVRDKMDFGHEVGEVELQVEVERGISEEEKGRMMEEMDGRIEEFMTRYAWAWDRGPPMGKLTAYFEMVERGKEEEKKAEVGGAC